MTDSISALTHSRFLSLTDAMQRCCAANDMSDLQHAHACINTLLARPRPTHEDAMDTCDGLAALHRLINESMTRREELIAAALRTLCDVIERERAETTT
jgi:hypothetical protein